MYFPDRCRRRAAPWMLLIASLSLAACGGGGSSGGGSGGGDGGGGDGGGGNSSKPTAEIVFPPDGAVFNGGTIVVRGSADDDGSVKGVSVNGVNATSQDDFQTWTASVPLAMGSNELVVAVEDDDSQTSEEATTATVTRSEVPLFGPTGIAFDVVNTRAIVLDGGMSTLFAVDVETGEREVLSSNGVGSGPLIQSGLHVDLSEDGLHAYLYDYQQQALFEIALATGNRKIISSATRGSGELIGTAWDLATDSDNGRSFVAEPTNAWGETKVHMIDHATGDRTLVSSSTTGAGPQPGFVLGLDWDAAMDRLVLTTGEASLVFLTPGGQRTFLGLVGAEAASAWTYDVTVDSAANVAYVTDDFGSNDRVFKVDLATGQSSLLAVADTVMETANAVAWDSANKRVLVADNVEKIIRIDPATKALKVLSDNSDMAAGTGPAIPSFGAASYIDAATRTAYILSNDNALITVDLATGNRTVADAQVSSEVVAMTLDAPNKRLLGIGSEGGMYLLSIDIETGVSTNLATLSNASRYIQGMAIDPASNRLFLSDSLNTKIVAVSLDTYVDEVFSASYLGTGSKLRTAGPIMLDAQRDRLLMGDQNPVEIRSISLSTGDRETVFLAGDNVPPTVLNVTSLAMGDDDSFFYMLDGRAGNVVKFDAAAASRTAVAGASMGSKAAFGFARHMSINSELGLAWAFQGKSILVIDLIGGDSAIVSR